MELSSIAKEIHVQINKEDTKLGDLRKIAKEIKKDHQLALELWETGDFYPQQLAILLMDKKLCNEEFVDQLVRDIQQHKIDTRNQLSDWLMANQLMKDKKTIALIESWEHSSSAIKRRIFWYYQGRLRWTGKTPPNNTSVLLDAIEDRIAREVPEVQWAMNFTAAQIGIYDVKYRTRCIAFGEQLGLYKDKPVAKNCTPDYLPEWIRIEVDKLN